MVALKRIIHDASGHTKKKPTDLDDVRLHFRYRVSRGIGRPPSRGWSCAGNERGGAGIAGAWRWGEFLGALAAPPRPLRSRTLLARASTSLEHTVAVHPGKIPLVHCSRAARLHGLVVRNSPTPRLLKKVYVPGLFNVAKNGTVINILSHKPLQGKHPPSHLPGSLPISLFPYLTAIRSRRNQTVCILTLPQGKGTSAPDSG